MGPMYLEDDDSMKDTSGFAQVASEFASLNWGTTTTVKNNFNMPANNDCPSPPTVAMYIPVAEGYTMIASKPEGEKPATVVQLNVGSGLACAALCQENDACVAY